MAHLRKRTRRKKRKMSGIAGKGHMKWRAIKKHKRRVSGLPKDDMSEILGIVAGAVLAGLSNKMIPATIDPKYVALGKVAVGFVLPMVVKNPMVKAIGKGFIAVGSVEALKSFGVLSGLGAGLSDSDMLAVAIEGIGEATQLPVVEGEQLPVMEGEQLSVIEGDERILAGDERILAGFDDEF